MADPITQPDVTIPPVTAEPYVAEAKNKLTSLRDGLKTNLGPYPQVQSISDIRKKLGPNIDKPISSYEDYIKNQSLVRGQEEQLAQTEAGLKQRLGALESQQEQEKRIVETQQKAYAADKVNELRRGQEQILEEIDKENRKELHFTQENVQSIATLFSLLGVVSIGGGKGTRLSALNSMKAMTGMLQGWQQGRADLWKREQIEFDKNMAKTRAKLEAYSRKAELAWKTMPYDLEKANGMMAELVAETGSQIVREKANLQGIPAAATYLNNLYTGFNEQFDKFLKQKTEARATETLEETKRHNKKVEGHQARMENRADYQYFVTNDNQVVYINKKNPKDTGIVKDMEGNVRKLGAPIPTDKMPKKGETAAKFVGDTIGRKVDVSAAEKLTGTVDYISKLDNLAKKSVSLGNVAGLSVSLADKVNGLLKASVPVDASGQQIITQEALDAAWQKAQEGRDFTALSDKSKVMAKAELDTIMSYLQSKYGNRAPVAEFRAAQNVISRRSASPTAFNQVMKEEKESAYKRLIGAGFTADDIAKVNKKYKEEEGRMRSLDSPSSASNVPAGVDPATWEHMTDAERALWQN
jgi:hypothetical protein